MRKRLLLILIAAFFSGYTYAADYYVSPNGNDSYGDGSSGNPWRSLELACRRVAANSGHRIILAAGTYTENAQCVIPGGVTVLGAGVDQTVITGSYALLGRGNPFNVINQNVIRIGGDNVKIGGFTIDGKSKSVGGGIYIRSVSNVEVFNVKVNQVHASAVWVVNSSNIYVHDVDVYDCSWSSSGWASGAVHYGSCENVTFERVNVKEVQQRNGSEGGGNAFKALGGGSISRVRFIECDAEVYWYGTWQDGRAKNISLEFESVNVYGCEVVNSTFNASVSLVGFGDTPQRDAGGYEYSVRFAGNVITNTAGSNTLELALPYSVVENNYFDNKAGGYGIKNWNSNTAGRNWIVRNNVFWMQSSGWPTSVIGSRGGVSNLEFYNNTVHFTGPFTAVIAGYGPGQTSNLVLDRNIFIRTGNGYAQTEPARDMFIYARQSEGYHPVNGVTVRNNIFYNFPENYEGPVSGVNSSGNRREDPQLNMSGARPFPYYDPRDQSLANSLQAGAKFSYVPPQSQDPVPEPQPEPQPEPEQPEPVDPLAAPVRINAGGKEFSGSDGTTFIADQFSTGTSKAWETPLGISDTDWDALYQSERYGQQFAYEIPMQEGTYDVVLHMAEIYWEAANKRVFSVNVEGGNAELADHDIYASAGFQTAQQYWIEAVDVTDGVLNIAFQATVDMAKISAIEVLDHQPNTPPVFNLDKDAINTVANFEDTILVTVTPEPVPDNEKNQKVTYAISPENPGLVNAVINPNTGLVKLFAKADQSGSQVFTITGNDGQSSDNTYTQSFSLTVSPLIQPDPVDPGSPDPAPDQPTFAVRINAGGKGYQTQAGLTFEADNEAYVGGASRVWARTEGTIDGTNDDDLYMTERWGNNFSYNVEVPNGRYHVKLHFAEIYWSGDGYRLFDVNVEGGEVELSNLDIHDEAGRFAALVKTIEFVEVVDGEMNIDFVATADNAKLSALEIIQAPTSVDPDDDRSSIRLNAGAAEAADFNGHTFYPDGDYVSKNTGTYLNRNITDIAGTTNDDLYKSERVSDAGNKPFTYEIPVQDGEYIVYLHFAEVWWQATGGSNNGGKGSRIFDVKMEGKEVLADFDIMAEVNSMTALAKRFQINVSGGALNIELAGVKDRAKISAIEVLTPGDEMTSIVYEDPRSSLRINAGADEDMMFGGYLFAADNFFTDNSKSWRNEQMNDVLGTSFDELYLTERYADANLGSFSYNIPVENGEYVVYLHFAEIWHGATGGGEGGAGKRVFSVNMEGTAVLSDFDLATEAGAMTAVAKEFSVTVEDGELNINLTAGADRPKISAIEVLIPSEANTSVSLMSSTSRSFFDVDFDPAAEEAASMFITLAPNPTTDNTRLMVEDTWEGVFEVRVFDAWGRLYKTFAFDKQKPVGKYVLEVNDLTPGLYVVSVVYEGRQQAAKLWLR